MLAHNNAIRHIAWFQKISTPTPRMVIGNSDGGGGGGGVSIAKNIKGKYEAKLEFPGGGGFKPKNHPWGRYGYFLEPHIMLTMLLFSSKLPTFNLNELVQSSAFVLTCHMPTKHYFTYPSTYILNK